MKVCDPVLGLPRSCKFLPSVAELSEALIKEMEEIARPIRREIEREQRRAEAEEWERNKPTPEQRERVGKMLAELKRSLQTGERTFLK